MSEQLIESLNRQVQQLQQALKAERRDTRAVREALGARSIGDAAAKVAELVEASKEWPRVMDELDTLKKRTGTPDDKDIEIGRLKGELLGRDHRDAWRGDKRADGVKLDHLWHALQYTADGEAPTADRVAELLQAAPAAFLAPTEGVNSVPSPSAPARPTSGPGGSQGAPDRAPARVTYTADEIRTPGWEKTRPDLKAAFAAVENGGPPPLRVESR